MLLLGEGSEATEPYNKYANLLQINQVKYILADIISAANSHRIDRVSNYTSFKYDTPLFDIGLTGVFY